MYLGRVIQLLDILGSLVERPLIRQEFNEKYPRIVTMMAEELYKVKQIYDENLAIIDKTGKMEVHKNMAKVSGYLKWTNELKNRITIPMTELRKIEHPYDMFSLVFY